MAHETSQHLRSCIVLLALTLLAAAVFAAPEPAFAGADISGDVDCNSAITSVDSLLLLRHVAGLGSGDCLSAGDVDCDGDMDAVDSLHILRHLVGFPVELPTGCPPIGSPVGGDEIPVSFVVDPTLEPNQQTIPGISGGPPRELATVADERGNQADFVEDEILLSTANQGELNSFLQRWDGEVLAEFDPDDLGLEGMPPLYLVRIDATLADPQQLADDIKELDPGNRGGHHVSSAEGLSVLAAAADEAAGGMTVGVNWVMYGSDLRERFTTEAAFGPAGYTSDAYTWNYMDTGSTQDIGVTEAWTALVKTNRLGNRTTIAILDGGFAPDADFPTIASSIGPLNVTNPLSCTGGSPCPWHGTNVLGAAMGITDNSFGAAGPGGPVARAVTVHRSWDIFNGVTGVAQARAAGARIINMSWGARVPASLAWTVTPFDIATDLVEQSGAIIFAAAGNNSQNVDREDCFIVCWEEAWHTPCENDGVTCVGALGVNSQFAAGFSNTGRENVDIFAPGTVFVGPDPAAPGGAQSISGTSFSSPFMAGVAALVWAADPGLDEDEVRDLIYDNAHSSPDDDVERYVDAWAAVRDALGGNTPPNLDIITPSDGSSFSRGSALVSFSADASDSEDGSLVIDWTSSIDGVIGSGTLVQRNNLSFGTHVIMATTTDSGGFSDFESISVTIIDDPPIVSITNPPDGAEFFQGQTITLAGTSLDTNVIPAAPLPNGSVRWRIDGGGIFATGHNATIPGGTLTVGDHTIEFEGIEGALASSATVDVTINPNPPNLPPDVVITSPAGGSSFLADAQDGGGYYRNVNFTGSANDPEDGPLSGASLQWSYREGTSGPFTNVGTGTTETIKLYVTDCFGTAYQVRLTATDSDLNTSSYTITVSVYTLC